VLEWARRLRRSAADEISEEVHPLARTYRDNVEVIYRHIYRRVGNRETAEDLTGEVFLKALHWLDTERSPQAVQSWLYATARTTIIDYWRASAAPTVDVSALEQIMANPEREEQAAAGSADVRVERLLDGLAERERQVLILRFLHGNTTAEIAEELKISEGNVRVLQHRALRRAAERWEVNHD